MAMLQELLDEHEKLTAERAGQLRPSEELKQKVRTFLKKLGTAFTDNNALIAANPTHSRVKQLRDANKRISKLITAWQQVVET